jgi:anaerobic selenocysteine-containing dehydrogenase
LTVVDPYRTETARRADTHLMIRPGTDAALALAMMNVMIEENLLDHDFIARRTVGFTALKDRAADYSPDKTAGICGVAADQIRELARGYGRAKCPYIRTGWGPARQLAGAMALRTIALLPGLTGAFARPGAGITRSLGGAPSDLSFWTRPDLCPPETRWVNMVELGQALTELENPPIRYLHVYLSNPAAVAPQSRQVMAGLAREDLFVSVQEMFMTDTARMADIVLPGASFLEVKDLYRAYGHNYLQMAEPAIPPVGQSRSTLDIFQALAEKMGFVEPVFSMTEDQVIKELLADPSPYMAGLDKDRILSGRAVRLNIADNPYAESFATPSGKVEFFSQAWADRGLDPLPDGRPVRDPEGGGRYELEFITPPHRLFLNSAFNEIAALREAAGPPSVLIHPKTAAQRRIADGSLVRVYNDRGECRLTARVTEDTRPELLVAEGLRWPGLHPKGKGVNQLTSQRLTDAGQTSAFHCSRVEVAPARKRGYQIFTGLCTMIRLCGCRARFGSRNLDRLQPFPALLDVSVHRGAAGKRRKAVQRVSKISQVHVVDPQAGVQRLAVRELLDPLCQHPDRPGKVAPALGQYPQPQVGPVVRMVGKGSFKQPLGGLLLCRDLFYGGIVPVGECQSQARQKVGMKRRQLRILHQLDGFGKSGKFLVKGAAEPSSEGKHLLPAQSGIGFKVENVLGVF